LQNHFSFSTNASTCTWCRVPSILASFEFSILKSVVNSDFYSYLDITAISFQFDYVCSRRNGLKLLNLHVQEYPSFISFHNYSFSNKSPIRTRGRGSIKRPRGTPTGATPQQPQKVLWNKNLSQSTFCLSFIEIWDGHYSKLKEMDWRKLLTFMCNTYIFM
jgi:hypothetical protein